MSKQNRVDPFGNLIATPARGAFMGNRGCLHDQTGNITKTWSRNQWVTCLLAFKGRHRQIMTPGRYTELFFLDEATALAAGHRPCGTCQKAQYDIFKQLWVNAAQRHGFPVSGRIEEIDERLHAERLASAGQSVSWTSEIGVLPNGTMLTMEAEPSIPWLKWRDMLHRWTPHGYSDVLTIAPMTSARVVTPRSVVHVLSEGYWPKVHATAEGAGRAAINGSSPYGGENPASPERDVRRFDAARVQISVPVRTESVTGLHKRAVTPSGKELFTYFAAILRATGMEHGAVFPLKKFLGNFATHEKAGRIEKVESGYRLTPIGREYFADRYRPGNRQHVDAVEVEAMVGRIRIGGKDWEPLC